MEKTEREKISARASPETLILSYTHNTQHPIRNL